MGDKVSIAAGSAHKHPTLASGNSWSGDFTFSYANSGLYISSGTASVTFDYNLNNITVATTNGNMTFLPHNQIQISANASVNVTLEHGRTYIFCSSGNVWSGTYLVQLPHSDGAPVGITELTTISGWLVESVGNPIIKITNYSSSYVTWIYWIKI